MLNVILGIDVGGTKTKIAVLKNFKKHKPIFYDKETPKDYGEFLLMLEGLIKVAVGKNKVASIGIALPGAVNIKKGILTQCHNLSFLDGWNAAKFLKKFSKKVVVDNDSRAFLAAEMGWGKVKKYKNIVGITIGTGVGGGVAVNGKIYYGANDAAGEVGKMIIDNGQTLEKLGNKSTQLNPTDRNKAIGHGLANLSNVLNPDAIILGGGGISGKFLDLEAVKKYAYELMPYEATKKVKIIGTDLGYYASAIGAALLAKQ